MHTVVELPGYLRDAEELFSPAERDAVVSLIAADPQSGDVIPGTGGFRKVRFAMQGRGKRGGARIVYILRNESFPVFLVAAFAKNRKENLSKAEQNELARLAETLFSRYGKEGQ